MGSIFTDSTNCTLKLLGKTLYQRTGQIVQWYSTCPPCIKLWVQCSVPYKSGIEMYNCNFSTQEEAHKFKAILRLHRGLPGPHEHLKNKQNSNKHKTLHLFQAYLTYSFSFFPNKTIQLFTFTLF